MSHSAYRRLICNVFLGFFFNIYIKFYLSIYQSINFILFITGTVVSGCRIYRLHLCRRLPQRVYYGTVGWGCRIHRLHLCREARPPQRMSRYDSKQSDGEIPVMLELWGMQRTLHCHRSQAHSGQSGST